MYFDSKLFNKFLKSFILFDSNFNKSLNDFTAEYKGDKSM